jgi:asparagine synthase (glutamine-hydrolysing)
MKKEIIMCGIAGVFHRPGEQDIERMLNKMGHRGPDGHGIKNLPTGTLGNTCLSVSDTDGRKQPVGLNDAWITFDGRIYNCRELIHDHLQEEALHSSSDAEVLLHLYLKFGPRCVEMLDGIFAFAIIQGKDLFMARDPLGIKPMYCCVNQQSLYFASEIKALAEVAGKNHEFPAGHWFHSRAGWHSYFDLDSLPTEAYEAASNESLQATLQVAVRKRLPADVPVGVSLSGGLGSRIVAALASRENPQVHSFAVGMESSEDVVAARKVAEILGTLHHERIYSEQEVIAALPKIIYHLESFDPALVRSAIPNLFLAEIASKYVKVILTGEGADEIYGGYDYLGSFASPDELQDELIDITAALRNTILQRTDRIFAAFGLESRLPFLDIKVVTLGLCLPTEEKTHRNRPAQHLLRKVFRRDLPREILDLPGQKLSKGTAASDFLLEVAEREFSDSEFQSERQRLLNRWEYRLPGKEALYYYKLLRQYYEDRWIFLLTGRKH